MRKRVSSVAPTVGSPQSPPKCNALNLGSVRQVGSLGLLALSLVLTPQAAWGQEAVESRSAKPQISDDDLSFFESHIRPVLVESCLDCHSAKSELSGGLSLDSQQQILEGGDSGAAIDLKDPNKSLLLKVISYNDPNLQMPPDERLPEDVVQQFRLWVERGAPDPREPGLTEEPESTALTVDRATEHWAYRPIDLDALKESSKSIDDFVASKLENNDLRPVGQASEAVLVRRLYLDLTGLPPTFEQIQDYVADSSDDKYANLVERLLASPAYGEHFARHWLDVARYAESITLRGFVLPNAWRYRDWTIDAYNSDMPLSRMVLEQIAGDLLASGSVEERARQVVATGFLALGNTNLEQQDKEQLEMDYIDEQLEVMGRAFLGQTIGCARCHDHKFDPIPTKDYYALVGIMRSTTAFEHDNVSKWIDHPLPLEPAEEKVFELAEAELKKVTRQEKSLRAELSQSKSLVAGEKHVGVGTLDGIVVDNTGAKLVGSWTESDFVGRIVGDHYIHALPKSPSTATFEPAAIPAGEYEVRVSYTANANRSSRAKFDVFSAAEQQTVLVNQREKPLIDGLWHSLGVFRFEENGQAYVMISTEGSDGYVIADAVQFLRREDSELGKQSVAENDGNAKLKEVVAIQERLKKIEAQKKELTATIARRPKYLTVLQTGEPRNVAIHVRGNVHTQTEIVPRGVLTALGPRVFISKESGGRRELARWIASSENPLTARVYANRVWSWLMGQGIVASPNNFGTTGFAPTHPELLDWLAVQLMDKQWSTKELVRLIVTSDAYKRSVADVEANRQSDPDNRFYWRAQQRRLSVEMLCDAMLTASGELDSAKGGPTIRPGTKADYSYKHEGTRRSIYQPVLRNSLPPLFDAFDFADPSASIGKRPRSTVATQALALRNSPWVQERAQATANRIVESYEQEYSAKSDERRIEWMVAEIYKLCLQRAPSPSERNVALAFLSAKDESTEERVAELVHALFCSLDFRYPE